MRFSGVVDEIRRKGKKCERDFSFASGFVNSHGR